MLRSLLKTKNYSKLYGFLFTFLHAYFTLK